MTGYYITLNGGIDFELFSELNIGSKKLKQDDWFAVEPQAVSFEMLYYTTPNTAQQTESNRIIDTIFNNSEIIKGISAGNVIRLYYNEELLFTGIVDLTQSDYNIVTKDSKIYCYDYLKLLSIIKNSEDYNIIDDIKLLSEILTELQSNIDNLAITTANINSQASLNTANIVGSVSIPTGQELNSFPDFGDYFAGFVYLTTGNYRNTINFAYFYLLENDLEFRYEYFLIRIDGLIYTRIEGDNRVDEIPSGQSSFDTLQQRNSILYEVNIFFANYDVVLSQATSDTISVLAGGSTRTYTLNYADYGSNNSFLSVTGRLFSNQKALGKYLVDGYIEENTNNIVDIFKMYLKTLDLVCFADGGTIQIANYNQYQSTVTINDEDIISILQEYNEIDKIEDIDNVEGETDKYIEELNRYYSTIFTDYSYNINILLSGNENIKAGDRLLNTTYNLDVFIIEIKLDYENNRIKIKAV